MDEKLDGIMVVSPGVVIVVGWEALALVLIDPIISVLPFGNSGVIVSIMAGVNDALVRSLCGTLDGGALSSGISVS